MGRRGLKKYKCPNCGEYELQHKAGRTYRCWNCMTHYSKDELVLDYVSSIAYLVEDKL